MRLLLLVTSILIPVTQGIYEDQVGKFDWRKTLIGCPTNVYFDSSGKDTDSDSDRLVVVTEQNIIASLCLHSGKMIWRRVLEPFNSSYDRTILHGSKDKLYTLSNSGKILRIWKSDDGSLIRQFPISNISSEIGGFALFKDSIFIATSSEIIRVTPDNDITFSVLPHRENVFVSFFFNEESLLVALKSSVTGKMAVFNVNEDDASLENEVKIDLVFDSKRCRAQRDSITCFDGKSLTMVNIFNFKQTQEELSFLIEEISVAGNIIAARGKSVMQILKVSENVVRKLQTINVGSMEVVGLVSDSVITLVSPGSIRTIAVDGSKEFIIPRENDGNSSPPKSVFVKSELKSTFDYELVTVGSDCRVQMLAVTANRATIEWSKEESLINSNSVEMVDLPLSEGQQMIEDEFEEGEGEGYIVPGFLRRLHVQFGQFIRSVSKTIDSVATVLMTFTNNENGLASFISSLRSVTSSTSTLFERDYFNLRKVILVSTINGAVFGIDSKDGSILWKIWLGAEFKPLKSTSKISRVPLYVQRSTAHYQLDGIASVVFSHKESSNGVAVTFNPMNGKIHSRTEFSSPIKRVMQLPFTVHKHTFPLAIIDKNNEILSLPRIPEHELTTLPPVYIIDTDERNSAHGLKIDFSKQKATVTWSGNLGITHDDEIIEVKGKPYQQKVHSQGRVLVNRDVQYKYVNPNLAAVVSLHKTNQVLTIVLVDIVTGQLIHSATIGKAAKPVHIVHCENWIAYSYWSEKGRRTELGVIELYQGSDEHAQKDFFNSKYFPKHPPVVLAQSYIYAQGVDAMSVSETEKGLTTRSLLIAHPTGGIHEVSRKLLDATRPLELTPAMREEMIIGYIPEIAASSEELINYNQTVYRVRGIKTSPSGLESTSLILAYGTDLFFTRHAPSGTFDILKDDFDHFLISIVLSGLILGSYVTKRLSRTNALAAQWS